MPYLDRARRASFQGIDIPYTRIGIRSVQRAALHKYPYVDLADIEKLGRDPYMFRLVVQFDENLEDFYPGNFPGDLTKLRKLFEKSTEDTLVLPLQGTTKAYFLEFECDIETRTRSGAVCSFGFLETRDQSITYSDLTSGASFDQVAAAHSAVLAYVASLSAKVSVDASLLDKLQAGINDLLAAEAKGELYTQLAQAKLRAITNTINQIDDAITSPVGWPLIDSLRDLWSATSNLVNDASLQSSISTWKVPRLMSIQQVSNALYKDTSHTIELLKLNDDLGDAAQIAAGTKIFYIPPTVARAA